MRVSNIIHSIWAPAALMLILSGGRAIATPILPNSTFTLPEAEMQLASVPTTQTYQQPDGLYAISLPAGYTYEDTSGGIRFVAPDRGFGGMVVVRSAEGQQFTNDQLAASVRQSYSNEMTDITWQGVHPQADGSLRLDWVGTAPDGNRLDAITFVEQHGDHIFLFELFGINKPYQNYTDDAAAITATYRVSQQ